MREEQVREMGRVWTCLLSQVVRSGSWQGLAVCLAIKEGWAHSDYKRRMILSGKEKEGYRTKRVGF